MKVINVALAIGIAILLPILSQMTVRIWAEPPEYGDYYQYYPSDNKTVEEQKKAEGEARKKREIYERKQAEFNLQMFYVTFPLGILEIVAGFLLRRRITLAAGIIFGGLGTVAFCSFASWETLPGWTRYLSLIFALVLLIGLALALDRQGQSERQSI